MLILFFDHITHSKDALYAPFLTSPQILQNIFEYSALTSTTKFLAKVFIEAVVNKMTLKEIYLFETNSEDYVLDEDLFIVTALIVFPNLISSSEYRSRCESNASNKKYERQLMRRIIERNILFKNRIRVLPTYWH